MADESPDFESSPNPLLPTAKGEVKKGFFQRIRSFLPIQNSRHSEEGENNLAGRIHAQLYNSAHSFVQQLHRLKEELRKQLIEREEEDLLASVEMVIDPLLREYQQIESKFQKNPEQQNVENQTTLKTHSLWVQKVKLWEEKAKLWAPLIAGPLDRDAIITAICNHAIRSAQHSIDRDLQSLEEYIAHELNILEKERRSTEFVAERLRIALKPYFHNLQSLRYQNPSSFKLEDLETWKSLIDQLRSQNYNEALHIIDSIIEGFLPRIEIKSESLQENPEEIA